MNNELIERAIESAKCRIYWVRANVGQSLAHQMKADNQAEIQQVTIEALEKLIPKKTINKKLRKYSGGTQALFANCPICEQPVTIYNGHQNNKEFRRDEDVFCKHCGQALDWSEEDD